MGIERFPGGKLRIGGLHIFRQGISSSLIIISNSEYSIESNNHTCNFRNLFKNIFVLLLVTYIIYFEIFIYIIIVAYCHISLVVARKLSEISCLCYIVNVLKNT